MQIKTYGDHLALQVKTEDLGPHTWQQMCRANYLKLRVDC